MYVKFTADGTPGWFGPQPVSGSEPLDTTSLPDVADVGDFLIAHRLLDGKWVLRDPVKVTPPTAEEIAAEQEEAYQAAVAAREEAVDAAILASPAYRSFIRGDMTLTAYRDAASQIEAQFPAPTPVEGNP